MNKIYFFAAILIAVAFTGCGSDDSGLITNKGTGILTGEIDENVTLTNDRIWYISGRAFVTGGATLTIEPGTIIKGMAGTGSNASGLYIAQDGMIDAVGTPGQPIIFTSEDDNIDVGQLTGTNLNSGNNQLWGGVVILGDAPISSDGGTTAQIEGVPAAESLGQYGGNDADDNRGKFKYISIRHGGTTIDAVAGKDINGLTLGGVGAGTEISHIEIFGNYDDGIEYFGGTVNTSNILVYASGDDAIDVDQAYSGIISNIAIYVSTAAGSDKAFEIDGPEGSNNADGRFTIQHASVYSIDGAGLAADFKSKAQGDMLNVKFNGSATIQLKASFSESNGCAGATDAYSNFIAGKLTFSEVDAESVVVEDGSSNDSCELTNEQATAESKYVAEPATGATSESEFDGWTAASIYGLLN